MMSKSQTDAFAAADALVDDFIAERRPELPTDPATRRALARALAIRLLNTAVALEHAAEALAREKPRRRTPEPMAMRGWMIRYLDWQKPGEQLAANWIVHLANAARECSPRETERYRPTLTVTRCTDDVVLRLAFDQLATDDQLVTELLTLVPPLIARLLRVRGDRF